MTTTTEKNLREKYPQYENGLETICQAIKNLNAQEKETLLKTLERYLEEGEKDSYQADTTALISFLKREELLPLNGKIIDFGAGAGDLVKELAKQLPRAQIQGVDLSPSFVARFNTERVQLFNALMKVGVIDVPFTDQYDLSSTVISVLTLDRLRDPAQLIKNMGEFSGSKVIAALLPNNPIDDNPSRQNEPIVYTSGDKVITSGKAPEQDARELQTLMSKIWDSPVIIEKVPYSVSSSGDTQVYELYAFFSRGAGAIPAVI